MINFPTGALRHMQEVRDLIYAAKIEGKESTLYDVIPHRDYIIKHKITSTAHIVGQTLFFNLSAKFDKGFSFESNILLPHKNLGISQQRTESFLFTNYWLAWAYYQRVKQGLKLDQQKGSAEVPSQEA